MFAGRHVRRVVVEVMLAGALAAAGASCAFGPARESPPTGVHGMSTTPLPGGCGTTQIMRGDGPAWLARKWLTGPVGLPYMFTSHQLAAGLVFGYPPPVGHPVNPTNKILWVLSRSLGDVPLAIDGPPVGAASPSVHVTAPAASELEYPSIVDVSGPGCWHLDLRWGAVVTAVDVEYQSK